MTNSVKITIIKDVGDFMDKRYINQIEVLVSLFTFDKGKLNVLLFKRTEDPYKGYWMLPSNLLMTTETINECASYTLNEMYGLNNVYLKQCDVFSKIDRLPNDRILANSLIGLIDSQTLFLKKNVTEFESAWFPINELPKMVYDHGDILVNSISFLKKELKNIDLLKILFPNDFTLSELQSIYEEILNKKLDRRNFRKKILSLNIIESTGEKNNSKNGRPAELYRYKEIEEIF